MGRRPVSLSSLAALWTRQSEFTHERVGRLLTPSRVAEIRAPPAATVRPPPIGNPLESGDAPHSFRMLVASPVRIRGRRRAARTLPNMDRSQVILFPPEWEQHGSRHSADAKATPTAAALAVVAARPGATAASTARRLATRHTFTALPQNRCVEHARTTHCTWLPASPTCLGHLACVLR